MFIFVAILLISINMIEITNAARKFRSDTKKLNIAAKKDDDDQHPGGCNPISRCRGIGIKDEIIKDIKKRMVKKDKSRRSL